MDNVTYRPLPGKGFGPFRRDRIFIADDHLLSVRSSRVVDVYERFYFGDIQGIYFRDRYSEYLMIVAALALPCLVLLLLAGLHHAAWLIPLVPLAAWTFAYALLGRQGDCHFQTLLGRHPVPAISRKQFFDGLLERIVPLVESAQHAVVPAEVVAPPTIDHSPPPMEPVAQQKPPLKGGYFEATFAAVAIASLFSLWNHRVRTAVYLDWAEYALSFAGIIMILVALARAYRVDVGGKILSTLWGIIVVQSVYSMGVGVIASIQNSGPRVSLGATRFDQHPIRSLPGLIPYATAVEALLIGLSVIGLLLVMDRKNRQPG